MATPGSCWPGERRSAKPGSKVIVEFQAVAPGGLKGRGIAFVHRDDATVVSNATSDGVRPTAASPSPFRWACLVVGWRRATFQRREAHRRTPHLIPVGLAAMK